jgi:hypothetical protein
MFEFLEDYRDLTLPAPNMEGVALTCRLMDGIATKEMPAAVPTQLRELWHRTAGGLLLVDERFGICGLTLFDPQESSARSTDRRQHGYDVYQSDWLLSKFSGDTDILLVDGHDTTLVSASSYSRDKWYQFSSLEELLRGYVNSYAEKFWEL